jgi:hypothetical protein
MQSGQSYQGAEIANRSKVCCSAKGSMVSILISVIAMPQLLQNALIRSSVRKPNGCLGSITLQRLLSLAQD